MVINRKKMAQKKLEQLKKGYSAFAETNEVAELIEKEIASLELTVHVDKTPLGSWFIPIPETE